MSESIKNFILNDDVTNTEKKKEPVRPKNVEYTTVFVSGPDFGIRRKTPKTSQVLVIIPSKPQLYIKYEDKGTIENLTQENLGKFLMDIDNESGFSVVDDNGVSPTWIKVLHKEAAWRENFYKIVSSTMYQEYIRANMYLFNEPYDRYTCVFAPVVYNYNFEETKVVFNDVAKYCSDIDILKKSLAKSSSNIENYTRENETEYMLYKTQNLFYGMLNKSDRYMQGSINSYTLIFNKWGIEGVREFIHAYMTSPVRVFPASKCLQNIFCRRKAEYNSYNHRSSFSKDLVCETNFDMRSLIDYLFYQCTEQGYALYPTNFWDSFSDYLNMQLNLYGKITDKYSENLMSDEARISAKVTEQMQNAFSERFSDIVKKYEDCAYHDDEYCIIVPQTTVDIIEEGMMQSNCVASYIPDITAERKMVFFMRTKENPKKSLITLEVHSDGTLGQVLKKYNRQPEPEQLEFVRKWHKNIFQKKHC